MALPDDILPAVCEPTPALPGNGVPRHGVDRSQLGKLLVKIELKPTGRAVYGWHPAGRDRGGAHGGPNAHPSADPTRGQSITNILEPGRWGTSTNWGITRAALQPLQTMHKALLVPIDIVTMAVVSEKRGASIDAVDPEAASTVHDLVDDPPTEPSRRRDHERHPSTMAYVLLPPLPPDYARPAAKGYRLHHQPPTVSPARTSNFNTGRSAYVLVPPLPPAYHRHPTARTIPTNASDNRVAAIRRKKSAARIAKEKSSSARRRKAQLEQEHLVQDRQDLVEHGMLRRYLKSAHLQVLGGIQPFSLSLNLGFELKQTKVSLRELPVASTGWTGSYVQSSDEDRAPHDLQYFLDQGFKLIEWDGTIPRALLDALGRVFIMLAGMPKDVVGWKANQDEVVKLFESLRQAINEASKHAGRRGEYSVVTCGVSFGCGQTEPMNIAQGSIQGLVDDIRVEAALARIAAFMDNAFKTFSPEMYAHYEKLKMQLLRDNPDLRFNWERCVYAAASLNLGPQTITSVHTDHMNYAPGWCGIMALGNYNYKKGGHLVLWDLKLVIEFPPGAVIFIPSAILRHSNTTVQPGEKRMSFTQFTAGSLFRWVDCGFQTQKNFFAGGGKHNISGKERWMEGIARYAKWTDILKARGS